MYVRMYHCNHLRITGPEERSMFVSRRRRTSMECPFGKRRNLGIIAVEVHVSMRVICLD